MKPGRIFLSRKRSEICGFTSTTLLSLGQSGLRNVKIGVASTLTVAAAEVIKEVPSRRKGQCLELERGVAISQVL